MPVISPFRGLRYNPKVAGSLERLVTPPYDVISPKEQAAYYQRHPLNFIRLSLGKRYPSDDEQHNRYSRARATFEEWLRKGILAYDLEPSVYPYEQEYHLSGRRFRRLGLVALVRLDSKRIYRHEEIKKSSVEDRYWLLEKLQSSLSPIFGLIPDERLEYRQGVARLIKSQRPILQVREHGVVHRLWRVNDKSKIRRLSALLRSKEMVIADGHHRFEAALSYRNKSRETDPSQSSRSPYNYAMFYLASAGQEEPGLLPTHRLVSGLPKKRLRNLLEGLKKCGRLQKIGSVSNLSATLATLRRQGRVGIGLYTGNGASQLMTPVAGCSYGLDVEWLHQEILPQWIGPDVRVSYTPHLGAALGSVRTKSAQALFVMQPPQLKDVLERARVSQKMPRKTTYFTPKPLDGLVEYCFGEN